MSDIEQVECRRQVDSLPDSPSGGVEGSRDLSSWSLEDQGCILGWEVVEHRKDDSLGTWRHL